MAEKARTPDDLADKDVKALSRILQRRGVMVRREKLIRGSAFRAKSGSCRFQGEKVIFLDQSLPRPQQLSFLVDYILERHVQLSEDEAAELSPPNRTMLSQVLR